MAAFRKIPAKYQGFLVTSGHCCNELAVLLPYIMFEHDPKRANEFEASFIVARYLTIERILVSKIFEYNKLCSKFFRRAGASEPILLELSHAYKPIAGKIASANRAAGSCGTRYRSDYDQQHVLASIARLPEAYTLRFMAGRIQGLTLFDFAEDISSRPIFDIAGDGDIEKGLEVTRKFISELYGAITAFHARATARHLRPLRYGDRTDEDENAEEVLCSSWYHARSIDGVGRFRETPAAAEEEARELKANHAAHIARPGSMRQ